MEQETTRMRITTVSTFAAAMEFVAFNITAIYGWPVGDPNAASMSPRLNIRVTAIGDWSVYITILTHINSYREERTDDDE